MFGSILSGASNTTNQWQSQLVNRYESDRAYQRDKFMSGTAYRRTVKDMRAAGLNPAMMMKGFSPSQAPSAKASQGVSPASMPAGKMSELVGKKRANVELATAKEVNKGAIAEASIKVNQAQLSNAKTNYVLANQNTIIPGLVQKDLGYPTAVNAAGGFTRGVQNLMSPSIFASAKEAKPNLPVIKTVKKQKQNGPKFNKSGRKVKYIDTSKRKK